jgi:hypothetical protein
MNRRVVRWLAVVAALVLLVPAACVTLVLWPRDGDQFVPTLDALAVPSTWKEVHTEVLDGDPIIRERATRYYFVEADSVDSLQEAKQVAEAAGFVVRPRVLSINGCQDSFPPEAMDSPCGLVVADECRASQGLPQDCSVEALRWFEEGERIERLWIGLRPRGSGFDVGRGDDRRYVSDPDLALVAITVDRANRDAYLPLPSWPPTE